MKFSSIQASLSAKVEKVKKFVSKKSNFNKFFLLMVLLLFLVRIIWPSVLQKDSLEEAPASVHVEETANKLEVVKRAEASQALSVARHAREMDSLLHWNKVSLPWELRTDGEWKKHKVYSVPSYKLCFPDLNDLQLATASRIGIPLLHSRGDIDKYKHSHLVFVGNNPYYHVQRLKNSTPYLIPKAAMLLERIARNFIDSQLVKKTVPSKMVVTSVLRTRMDVKRLRNYNVNSSEKSCHFYGTTFDISYNTFYPVHEPGAKNYHVTRGDSLKFILSEVLNDLRRQGACYVKYERRQGCFHITAR